MEEKRKTPEYQLRANKKYVDKHDRINVVFPAGTRARMEAVGVKSYGAFIKEAVEKELSSLEKFMK